MAKIFSDNYIEDSGYLEYKDFKKKYPFVEKADIKSYTNPDEKPMEGAYGNVYTINYGENKTMNIVKKQYGGQKFYNFVKELSILKSIDHPNIAKVKHWTTNGKRYYFSQSYGTPLKELFYSKEKSYLTHERMYKIFEGVYSAIKFLHSKNIVHLDIKPENIIWNMEENRAELIDFGLSTYGYKYKNGLFTFKNPGYTLQYQDPEYSDLTYNNSSSDYYSMSITFIHLYLMFNNFKNENIPQYIYNTYQMEDVMAYIYSESIINNYNSGGILFSENYKKDLKLKEIINKCITPLVKRESDEDLEKFIEEQGIFTITDGRIEEPIMLKEPEYCNIAYTTIVNDVNQILSDTRFKTLARTGFLTHHIIHRTLPILGKQFEKARKIPTIYILKLACSAFYLANCVYGSEWISFEKITEKAGYKITVYDMIDMTLEMLKICQGVVASPTFWDYSESADSLPLYLESMMNCKYYPYQKVVSLPWDRNVSKFTNECYIDVSVQMLYSMSNMLHYVKKSKNKKIEMIQDIMINIEESVKRDYKKEREYCENYSISKNCENCDVEGIIDPFSYIQDNFFNVVEDEKIKSIYSFKKDDVEEYFLDVDYEENIPKLNEIFNSHYNPDDNSIYIPEENQYMILAINRVKDGKFDNETEIKIEPKITIVNEDYVLSGVISIANTKKGDKDSFTFYYSVYDETGYNTNFIRLYTDTQIFTDKKEIKGDINIDKNGYIILYTKKHDDNYRYMFEPQVAKNMNLINKSLGEIKNLNETINQYNTNIPNGSDKDKLQEEIQKIQGYKNELEKIKIQSLNSEKVWDDEIQIIVNKNDW